MSTIDPQAMAPTVTDYANGHPPLTEPVSTAIPPEGWMLVALDSRNAHLARCVREAEHGRIVITFAAAYEPGWLAEMRKLDARRARSHGAFAT